MRPLKIFTSLTFVALIACESFVASADALRFSVPDGRVLNEFYRDGPVAAHLVLTSGPKARIVVAFPAGNSGVALWFEAPAAFSWSPGIAIQPAQRELPGGTVLRGISAELVASGGTLQLAQAIAGSVRIIRAYQDTSQQPPAEMHMTPRLSANAVAWERRRLDGASGYAISISIVRGTLSGGGARPLELVPAGDGELRVRITALTGEAPLTALAEDEVLTANAAPDMRLRQALTFLSYDEKLLAGSWRFNTYFGRDTLMSLELLAPVLHRRAFEAGLRAVLERLNPTGEVAHEEDVGEYAVWRRRQQKLPESAAPLFDYKMVDDDFMLAVVAARYLLDTASGREHARAFLARRTGAGEAYGAALARNLLFVVNVTTPFARQPGWRRLVSLKPGEAAGNWRDSDQGLGGGRYPYDVNGALAPAALQAIARLQASRLLEPYVDDRSRLALASAATQSAVWEREAPPLFAVRLSSATARAEVEAYARSIGVDAAAALAALGNDDVRFSAVALDARGQPVPIVNSDEAFALLLRRAPPAEVERIASTLTRPFPAGLLTGAGLLVANPAYAPAALEPAFGRNRYHGTVIWSWQQALLATALGRQLERTDLTVSARAALERAQGLLQGAAAAGTAKRGAELWSWSEAKGVYRIESFGQRPGDETEANAAQLWSTVYLARPGLSPQPRYPRSAFYSDRTRVHHVSH
jgi:hypothetical protein